jgi:hypothetical protein
MPGLRHDGFDFAGGGLWFQVVSGQWSVVG